MYKISTLLDNAKELNNLKSDRELGKLLGIKNMATYRTRGAIPSDETAKKLAELTGIKYELVLASCHGATAKKNDDKEAVKAWRNIFKLAQSMGLVLIFATSFIHSPTPTHAATYHAAGNIESHGNIYYATLCRVVALTLVRLRQWFNPNTYYFYA